jgi:hypothetical protein
MELKVIELGLTIRYLVERIHYMELKVNPSSPVVLLRYYLGIHYMELKVELPGEGVESSDPSVVGSCWLFLCDGGCY